MGRTANKTQRKLSPFFSALAKEDIEYDDIELADIPSYVNVSFENHVTLALSGERSTENYFERSNPETDRKGVRIVWVEHAKTGELVPVALRGGVALVEDSSQIPENVSDDNDDVNSPLLMPPSLSGRQLNGNSQYLCVVLNTLLCHPSTAAVLISTILLHIGDAEGGNSSAAREHSIEQSNIAYADGVTLIRFIFFFVQGIIN